MKPNHYDCESCPHWDDINGCWANCKSYCGKEFDSGGEEISEEQEEDKLEGLEE